MKKLIMILALSLSVITGFAFTGGEPINRKALNTFHTEFTGATDATWTDTRDFYKVTFNMYGQQLIAYYNNSGEFIAVTRNISSDQLPLNLKRSLNRFMSQYWIGDLFEITIHDESSWYVTLESVDSKIVLRSEGNSGWTVFQKTEKI